MKKFPIALQLYSVRDYMERDLEGTIKAVAKMGYEGVEFAGLFGRTPAQIKAVCEEAGIRPLSAHVPFDEMKKDPEGVAAAYAEIGVMCVVIPWLGQEYLPGSDGYGEFCQVVSRMAEALKPYGIHLCYHNHDFEFEKVDGKYKLDHIYDDNDASLLKAQIDTCWAEVGMGDPAAYLSKFVGRAPTVHLKDHAGEKSDHMYALIGKDDDNDASEKEQEAFELRPVGYGKLNFPAILEAAERVGAQWVIVEQDQASMGKDSMGCAQMSLAYVRSIMK